MAAIKDIQNPWRKLLRTPASWRGVIFNVETGAKISGRRTVVHEYPKRNKPYAEDMGQQAQRFHFSGYLIYLPSNALYNYVQQREKLVDALDKDGAGELIHPVFTFGSPLKCMCERYSMVENRQRGGFTEFEMQFVELGVPGNVAATTDTTAAVADSATKVEKSAAQGFDEAGGKPSITIKDAQGVVHAP